MGPRPFFLTIYPECPTGEDIDRRLPPHKLIIEPLVKQASEIVVHQKATYDFEVQVPSHSNQGRTLVLEPSNGLVSDWPSFWNSGGWKRGAISIKVLAHQVDWGALFNVSEYGGIWSSLRQILKGSPSGTVNYADKNSYSEFAVFSLSASNGIQWLDVWLPPNMCAGIEGQARSQCHHFVRACEQGKFEREIVYDRAPYADAT